MKLLATLLSTLLLTSCVWGGLSDTRTYFHWDVVDNNKLYASEEYAKHKDLAYAFLLVEIKDSKACKMDFVRKYSTDTKSFLCMEEKGWHLEGGPACENEMLWEDLVCVEWRKKHSAPDAKPWSYDKDSPYIINTLKLEQAPMKTKPRKKYRFFVWDYW